ncbi:MAG: CsiV family protein, partial [Pseudomonas sp.]
SSQHRILFHAAWRQPMTRLNASTPIAVVGGRAYNDRHELEGSLRLYFNNSEDRVMLEPNLWFSTFGSSRNGSANPEASIWQLPPLPEILQDPAAVDAATGTANPIGYVPTRIIQVNQTREARSNEFHYIDHPAIGVFIQLTPYEVPPLPEPVEPEPGSGVRVAPPLELQ